MLIGDLVKKSGLPKDTIRFYEKKGLISLGPKHRRENNYKEYPDWVLEKLFLVTKLKEMGFTLTEIHTFFSQWRKEDASCDNLKHTLESKLKQVDEQLQKLTELRLRVYQSLGKCNHGDCEFERTVHSGLCK